MYKETLCVIKRIDTTLNNLILSTHLQTKKAIFSKIVGVPDFGFKLLKTRIRGSDYYRGAYYRGPTVHESMKYTSRCDNPSSTLG